MRSRTCSQWCVSRASGIRVEPTKLSGALRRVPDTSIKCGRHIVGRDPAGNGYDWMVNSATGVATGPGEADGSTVVGGGVGEGVS